jgi:chloramphenicol-sensitive protein RarD
MSSSLSGVLAIVVACTIWGFSPIYYKLLTSVPPAELLAHRTFWSFVLFFGLTLAQGKGAQLRALVSKAPTLRRVALAAVLISVNWFLFIVAVQTGRTTETSLGYYIFPLVSVLLGVVVLKEQLNRAQIAAVGLATLGVLVLVLGLGLFPWLSLILATTFGLYGLVKKRLSADPIVSVTGEVLILLPVAFGWLVYTHARGQGVFGQDWHTDALLALSGLLTAAPLVLFSYASQRVTLSTLGLVQYLNPTLQFFCAVVLFREPFGLLNAVAFGFIWAALAVYSGGALRQDRARRRTAMAVSVSGTD